MMENKDKLFLIPDLENILEETSSVALEEGQN